MSLGNRYNQHSFAQVPAVNIQRSMFDRSSAVKDTFDFDDIIPIYVDEVIPGDTYNVNLNAFARLATQKVPIMDNMFIDYFFFYVPNRLVWENWEKFNGAQDNPADSTDFLLPTVTAGGSGFSVGSLYDKFGIPTDIPSLEIKNVLPLRCYNLIWNSWFRDENLQNSIIENTDDGPDSESDYVIKKRGKRHDYFTSALPWPQKGDAVELPLGSTAPVVSTNSTVSVYNHNDPTPRLMQSVTTSGNVAVSPSPSATGDIRWSQTGLETDLSSATAATINALREAFQLQSLFELDARGGTRYVEILKSHFGVTSPDFRLQRPEFLGSGRSTINSHVVPQTSESGTTSQANLAAFATSSVAGNRIGFSKSFTEHGYIIGVASARADLTYQQGINRMWNRSTRFDFYWPKLQQLGEQEILNKEIYADGTAADDAVFGYQERYAEYKYKPSEIHGLFRSTAAGSLDLWHQAEEFSTLPALNSTFIESNTPIERSIAVPSEPHLLFDAYIQAKVARPMMVYSTPYSLGRF